MRTPRSDLAAAPLAAAAGLLAAMIAGAGALAQDKGKGAEDPLRPNAPWAADGAIAESVKDGDKEVKLTVGKNATVILDIAGKFAVRLDRQERRGPPPISFFKVGRKLAVLGRELTNLDPRSGPTHRISPYHALVLGEGFDAPDAILPAAKTKFGDKTKWWRTTIDHFELPDDLWVKCEDGTLKKVTIGRDDRMLTTATYESAAFTGSGDLRKALAKGQPVRFKGTIGAVLYMDQKGRLVEETDKKKAGVKAEVHMAPTRLALLDANCGYEFVEGPESF